MSIGSWTPESESKEVTIEAAFLQRCIELSRAEQLELLPAPFSAEEQPHYASYMRLSQDQWQAAAEELANEDILHLIRFFTRAEMLISGWDADNDSPVIWLNKVLKKRGEKLSRDMLLWIRSNSNNRFIPNGGL
ncbi:MAG: hypothetical protein ACSHWQ_05560 [Spongiibacteraceae bacterium]